MSRKKEKEALDTLIAYRQTFTSDAGEKVLADLNKRYMQRSSYNDNPMKIAFNEGERNVVLTILAALNINEDQLKERVQNVNKEST